MTNEKEKIFSSTNADWDTVAGTHNRQAFIYGEAEVTVRNLNRRNLSLSLRIESIITRAIDRVKNNGFNSTASASCRFQNGKCCLCNGSGTHLKFDVRKHCHQTGVNIGGVQTN
jgi:hypothetical protein